jgi:hypothetical protein
MDKIVLDFFNYILKDGTFVIDNYNTYQGEVIFNKYISRELLK